MRSMMWVLLVCVFALVSASAATISVLGSLDGHCDYGCPGNTTPGDYAQYAAAVYSFTLNSQTTAYAITFSYGGGVNGSGTLIANGGFEPYLSLFDSGGNFLASTYFGTTCPPGANSVGGNCFDVSLDGGTLLPGVYQIALTAWENFSLAENYGSGHLSDGFTGLGNLGANENLNYAFDIILPANTPEPASLGLAAIGCGLLLVRKRILRRSA